MKEGNKNRDYNFIGCCDICGTIAEYHISEVGEDATITQEVLCGQLTTVVDGICCNCVSDIKLVKSDSDYAIDIIKGVLT